jgi:hypothetical protein
MRGQFLFFLADTYECPKCSKEIRMEVHTAQGAFWVLPEIHYASCGLPCIAGGVYSKQHFTNYHDNILLCNMKGGQCTAAPPKKPKGLPAIQLPSWLSAELLQRIRLA